MVREVCAHEYEVVRARGGAGESAEVADGVARGVDEVEGAVAEVVEGCEGADLRDWFVLGEGDLAEGATFIGRCKDRG
jgi:hypothetical protein